MPYILSCLVFDAWTHAATYPPRARLAFSTVTFIPSRTRKKVIHFRLNYPNPIDPLGQLGTDVPPETHAIKYYPPTAAVVNTPTVQYSQFEEAQGWRSCDNCSTPEEYLPSSLNVCGGCPLPNYWRAHYCRYDEASSPVLPHAELGRVRAESRPWMGGSSFFTTAVVLVGFRDDPEF